VAMVLLAVYFWTVRSGMKHYLVEVTGAAPDLGIGVPTASAEDDRA